MFLTLGATSFGGPAAHVANMERELVRKRGWLTEQRFLDLLGVANLVPGPSSTELAIHIGLQRGGWPGLVVAGAAFILPAMISTGVFAWMYVTWGAVPATAAVLYGVKPVVLAIVGKAIAGLTPRAARTWTLRALGAVALVAAALGSDELVILLGAGLLAAALAAAPRAGSAATYPTDLPPWSAPGPVATVAGGAAIVSSTSGIVTLPALFGVFLKIGSVLYGSGYVLVAFLRSELVERRGWLTEAQLLDSVAVGQLTPGPVFSTATFVGYVLGGAPGAVAATIGIFLPAFVFVALSGRLVERMRASPRATAFLDGVNVASIALMAWVCVQLGGAAIPDPFAAALGLVSLAVLLRTSLNPVWLVVTGAALGWAVR